MATLVLNTVDNIQFVNPEKALNDPTNPTLVVQSGEWETAAGGEPGVVFETYGRELPILTPQDARRLAKWLVTAANALDGIKQQSKKKKHRPHYADEDDDDYNDY